MYNLDTLIIPKENENWYEPAAAGETIAETELSAQKLCPFRKRTWFYTSDNYNSVPQYANHTEEEFLPCLKNECMFYNPYAPGGPCCTK